MKKTKLSTLVVLALCPLFSFSQTTVNADMVIYEHGYKSICAGVGETSIIVKVKDEKEFTKHSSLVVAIKNGSDKSVTFNQQINSITPILCEPKFLYYYLLSNTFFLAMIEKSTGTATPIINKGNWERLLFPLPPLAEQLRIVESIDAIFRCIEN